MTHVFDPRTLSPDAQIVLREIARLAATGQVFSSDAVRKRLDEQGVTVDGEAIGNAMRFASNNGGLIERVGETHSTRPDAHRRRIGLYRLRGSTATPKEEEQTTLSGVVR